MFLILRKKKANIVLNLGWPPISQSLMVTFPLVIFLMLKPTVGIISSVNWPDFKQKKKVLNYIISIEICWNEKRRGVRLWHSRMWSCRSTADRPEWAPSLPSRTNSWTSQEVFETWRTWWQMIFLDVVVVEIQVLVVVVVLIVAVVVLVVKIVEGAINI